MAKVSLVKGTTSYRAYVFIGDSSVSTGAGLTGLVYNSASLVASYVRPGASRTAITLATQTVTGAYSSGGFVEIDATNCPGLYRLDVPDAALASGVNAVAVMLKGASNMSPCVFEIELTGVDNQDAVRGGMTALPNAAAEAAGGLYTRGTGAGQINQPANGLIDVNTLRWNGTAVATPATAGIPDINVKNMNNVAATSITAINANQGTTQPVNYTGTGASALVKSDMVDVAGAAVSTSTAQIGVNAVNIGGTAQTGRDIGASVLLSSGTGTGQLDFTSGVVKANLAQILGTALTETAGQIAAAFKKFFDKAAPTGTINSIPDAVAGASGGVFIAGTNAATVVTTSLTTTFTGNLTGSVGSVSGAVGSVTGNVGGNVTGSVGSVATGGIAAASFAAGAIDNAAIATDAIGSAELASTAITEIQSGLSTLDAAGIRTAVGLASANLDAQLTTIDDFLDTEVAAIKAKTDLIPAAPAAVGDIPTAIQNADALLDRSAGIETGYTPRQSLRIMFAALAGKLSGAATTTVTIRNVTDSKNRIVATCDADGNRSAVSLDGT